ncbi:type II toxin-antitoxin system RelB/DinJ family antitoxin [Candidatus Enterococcus mangumiae]|uniref:Type II toxin-antitoxin system RelB/DinJ family antitoxin n=1 Tax=Candidatus Enterococcus mangumiae TaxID=2230878 RepID=A0ABZ2SW13_9ENTE|nr:type II toxin-antitoxin system RelB/DinJ family antitoxin [Enterococcus sp. DIV1094]MBO0489205.1 type II toxin-antitoxin system RelB/DinJ family antitoxin [Enterococcus sp. DIV1094]
MDTNKTKERLSINLDSELKKEVGSLLSDLGLDYTTAITIYFKQIAKKKKIPFELSTTSYYTIDEVAGQDWRNKVAEIKDEWE